MANPTLTKGSGTFSTSGTAILTLYNTQTENVRKSANIIPYPLPGTDSSSAIAFDLLGVTREINIRGKFASTDGTLTTFITDLLSLIAGTQGNTGGGQVGYVYTGVGILGTPRVYVNDVTIDYHAGAEILEYTIRLLEVSTSSA